MLQKFFNTARMISSKNNNFKTPELTKLTTQLKSLEEQGKYREALKTLGNIQQQYPNESFLAAPFWRGRLTEKLMQQENLNCFTSRFLK